MASENNPNSFTDNPLDRASHRRADEGWLQQARQNPQSRVVMLRQLKPLVATSVEQPDIARIGWVSVQSLQAMDLSESVFLGLEGERAHFALDVTAFEEELVDDIVGEAGNFIDVLRALAMLSPADASILAQAKSMLDWHQRHGFCARCGSPSIFAEAGYRRDCPQCQAQHFPRTDPVVITLVLRDDQCLLGRNAAFKWPMFSALAGFMEPGETIEEAVMREVKEEVNIDVAGVEFHSTQPWPYPSSLMIGCIAQALTDAITVDEKEIAAARWFSREELRVALAESEKINYQQVSEEASEMDGKFFLPPASAIAHQLIKHWLDT